MVPYNNKLGFPKTDLLGCIKNKGIKVGTQKIVLLAIPLAFFMHSAGADLGFTKQDLELVKSACLAGDSFEFATEADGTISVKNLEGKGKLHVTKKSVDTVDLPDSDKKQEFDDIRSCIKGYLLGDKAVSQKTRFKSSHPTATEVTNTTDIYIPNDIESMWAFLQDQTNLTAAGCKIIADAVTPQIFTQRIDSLIDEAKQNKNTKLIITAFSRERKWDGATREIKIGGNTLEPMASYWCNGNMNYGYEYEIP